MRNSVKKTLQQKLVVGGAGVSPPVPAGNGSANFGDPAFRVNKQLPIHRWVPWIAGFSSDFVDSALSGPRREKAVVLDPFAGVGTTNIQARLSGLDSVGFEINPYAVFACRTKIESYHVDPEALRTAIAEFMHFYWTAMAEHRIPESKPPSGFKTKKPFYSPKVLRKVLTLFDFINTLNDPRLRDIFRLAFASTMVVYSNYSYEPSLCTRSSSGKQDIQDYQVGELFSRRLSMMLEDILLFRSKIDLRSPPKANIINDSFFNYAHYLSDESVDIVITSPPYLNNYHYNRNTRPQLYWLGFVAEPREMERFEQANFGNFWQTVRDAERIDIEFSTRQTDIQAVVDAIRKKNPEKGVYGGEGWANYVSSYMNDCYRFCSSLASVLRRDGSSLVVIGNSIIQGIMIPTDKYLGEIGELAGLKLVRIEIPRATRVGNSIIRSTVRVGSTAARERLYEAVVEFKKV